MIKKSRKFLLSLLLAIFVVSALCPGMALAQTNGDVTAEIITEVFQDQTSAQVTVYLKNTGNEPIHNVQIHGALPQGVQVEEGNALSKQEETLTPGSETALQYVITTQLNEEGNNQGGTNDVPAGTGDGNQSTSGNNAATNDGSSNNVNTGDDANLVLPIVVCIIAAAMLVVVCVRWKKGKGMVSMLLCVAILLPSMVGMAPVPAAEAETAVHISTDVVLGGKMYTLTADVDYDLPEAIVPSGAVLTRAQWIDELLTAVGAPEQEVVYDHVDLPFTDIANHGNKNDILLAYANQVLPDMGTEFYPDAPADREFAAVTAVKALGFQPIADIVCSDSAAITYKQEVETAVAMDIFRLTNEAFRPAEQLTRAEADAALAQVREIANPVIPEGNTGTISYDEDVVIIPENANYTVNGTTITFTSEVEGLGVGSIFVMPDQTPYKVIAVQRDGSTLVVETVEPDISETLDSIEAAGTATVDVGGFIPAEGVTMVDAQTPMEADVRVNIADVEGSLDGPGSLNFALHKKIGEGELYGDVSISIPDVLYKADVDLGWSGFNVRDVFLKLQTDVTVDGGFKLTKDGEAFLPDKYIPNGGLLELGKIPIAGIPGVTIYARLGVKYEITGRFEAVWNLEGLVGAQVLNNRVRAIRNLTSDFDLIALGGDAKAGPQISGLLELCERWDLIDINLSAGLGLSGEMNLRNPQLLCVDGTVYIYGEFSAMDEGVIGKWLDIGYSLDFWNFDSSPWKLSKHFENFGVVNECTYNVGEGSIAGIVAKASDRRTPIQGATIAAYKRNSSWSVGSVSTDAYGSYIMNLPAGDYTIQVNAPGYLAFEYDVTITENEEKYLEALLVIDEGQEGSPGKATGRVIDAITGDGLEDVVVTLRKGWNKTDGDVVATVKSDQSGKYLVRTSIGNYTLTVEKEGYVTNTKNIVVLSESIMDQNVVMNPVGEEVEEANLRVVLTWGKTPRDLDSHLLGPTVDGSDYFHVYFMKKKYMEGDVKIADLDLDDVSSYGPETTSLYQKNASGTYSFYVHDFTNRMDETSMGMSQSEAIVEVYLDGVFYKAYPVPTGQIGTKWHVFDYDAATNTIKDVNDFVDEITYPEQGNAQPAAVVPMETVK